MAIINYYEKYGISQTDDLDKIQWVINQKITDEENDSFGEGHSDKMFILQLAKEAFTTAESKLKYDQDLADSMKKSDPDGERKASFDKWYADAKAYFNNGQYDLSKTAIDRAIQFTTPATITSSFYETAGDIYDQLNLWSQALDFRNQSILLSPDDPRGYYLKCVTIYYSIYEKNINDDKKQDIWRQLKANYELVINKVTEQKGDYGLASRCYDSLALIHYVYSDKTQKYLVTGNNNALAEEYAMRAIDIAPSDYKVIFAQGILDDIANRRAKVIELEQENENLRSKLKKDNDELARRNSDLRGRVSTAKSNINHATSFGDTSIGMVAWVVGIIAAVISFICFGARGTGAGIVFLIIAILVVGTKGVFAAKNKNISETLDYIKKSESQISSNENQININKSNTEGKISNNERMIVTQRAGLAPEPIVLEANVAE